MKKIVSVLLAMATMLSCFILNISAADPIVSDEGRLPFEDVSSVHWFHSAVIFCYSNGVIKGMNEYTFGGGGNLTRAQFVTMLAGLEGVDTTAYTVDKFGDVKSNHWYYGAVAWAYSEGIVSGMTADSFAPNGVLTRAQLARIMHNYMQDKYTVEISEDTLDRFPDKPKPVHWFYEDMKYAVAAGLISGMNDGTLAAAGNVTRGQAAVIFKNFMEKYFYSNCEHELSKASCTESAVCTKCGFVNGLPAGHILSAYDCVTGGTCQICKNEIEPSSILHNFAAATCTVPMTCTRCGETRGKVSGHSWKEATCTAPKTCTVCKATEGVANSHNWWAATCTNPKMCKVCYRTEGNALGHSYSGNSCVRCGELTPYAKAVYNYGQREGDKYSATTYASWYVSYFGANGVCYNTKTGDLGLFFGNYFDSGSYYVTIIYLPRSGTTCRFEYISANSSGKAVFRGTGYFDASTYKFGDNLKFSSYEGKAASVDSALSRANSYIEQAIWEGTSNFESWCGVPLEDFGFNCK